MKEKKQVTPVQEVDGVLLKRDDLYQLAGIRGGKVRSCAALMRKANGVVTASSRHSPQMQIVARLACHMGIACRCHVPSGEYKMEMHDAESHGAELVQHKPGYNSVIISRAKADAESRNWRYIPFGMECKEAVAQTAAQASVLYQQIKRHKLPRPKRIIVPVGSGMTLCGILHGLADVKRLGRVPIIGVMVGANPIKRMDGWAPFGWARYAELVKAKADYSESIEGRIGDVLLDPHYEAKALPFVKKGDLLWIVGIRAGLEQELPVG